MFKFLKDKSVLKATLDLDKGAMIKAETLAGVVESLAKTMEGVGEGLKLPKQEIMVKNIKIKKDKVQIFLKPVLQKKPEPNSIVINQENYFISLAKDLTSLGLLGSFYWFNYIFFGGSYFVNFLILCMIFLYCAKIKKSGVEHCSWHYGVSQEKIEQIKKIIKIKE